MSTRSSPRGDRAGTLDRVTKPREVDTHALDELLEDYWVELADSPLADSSIRDYFYFAFVFVRWINGEFTPGAHVKE